jgi:hypothetical protein
MVGLGVVQKMLDECVPSAHLVKLFLFISVSSAPLRETIFCISLFFAFQYRFNHPLQILPHHRFIHLRHS